MFFPTLLAAASLATSASAFSILTPGGPSLWWVAGSDNVVSWDCHNNPPAQTYQLLINNTSPTVLTSAQAILANLPNADCSHVITQQMVTLNAGTGYTLIIADQLDQTKQYAVSQEFEVKPVGSPFPPMSATPTGSGGASATSSGTAASGSSSPTSGSSNNNTSAAMGVRASVAGVLSVLGAAFYVL